MWRWSKDEHVLKIMRMGGGGICFRGLQVSCRNIKQNQSKTRLPFTAQEVLKLLISKRPKLKPLLRITTYTINKHP